MLSAKHDNSGPQDIEKPALIKIANPASIGVVGRTQVEESRIVRDGKLL
jgi:hypothetical protein